MSPALVITYLFLVLCVVVVVVLFCLGCGCHIPLGKCVRCFCTNTTWACNRCCKRKKKTDDRYKNIMDDVSEENAAKDEAQARKKRVEDDTAIAGCCSWVPWVLTCGMCCGAFKDEEEEAGRYQVVEISPRHSYNTRKSLMRRLTLPRMTSPI